MFREIQICCPRKKMSRFIKIELEISSRESDEFDDFDDEKTDKE